MKYINLLLLLVLITSCKDQSPKNVFTKNAAKIDTSVSMANPIYKDTVLFLEDFKSNYVDNRNVEIWLPAGYPKKDVTYKVLYMQDGQTAFTTANSNYGKSWLIGEKMDSLLQSSSIAPTIVVAAWSHADKRFNEYMPQLPGDLTRTAFAKAELKKNTGYNELYSDNYLKFLTSELKPYVDKNFQVSQRPEDTAIMGSSMGGLISLYAFVEYPVVFGRAACMSTHWPIPILGEALIDELPEAIPSSDNRIIYFDYGTETLDATYEPYQKEVDEIFEQAGYNDNSYMSLKFEGHEHDENYWNKRVHIPLKFLLAN
ncbi:alpha/beta hydrolase [Nonlabens ponticola]|uniref:Alpha/beta hydrolase n=1 Tax=Nonlabens ponticola TaxID=2496866 RepID=A0A3S9MZF9_9FLAO|nr:alpha/beta hydrolase-fold protein [Nonlabens ponticola]AZQ44548.1 alpha/beta hydrolase [Nonlabens ponticola]